MGPSIKKIDTKTGKKPTLQNLRLASPNILPKKTLDRIRQRSRDEILKDDEEK